MQGIIIDGVVASGKSAILRFLDKKITEREPSLSRIFLSEHYTQRMLEHLRDEGKLSGNHIIRHIDSIISSLENFHQMLNNSKFKDNPKKADLFVILERFILTHLSSNELSKNYYDLDAAKKHFAKIASFNISQLALIIPEDLMEDRIMSTINYRNDKWKEFLFSLGDKDDIANYYKNWQRRFIENIEQCKSIINTIIIEVKDNDFEGYSEVIMDKICK